MRRPGTPPPEMERESYIKTKYAGRIVPTTSCTITEISTGTRRTFGNGVKQLERRWKRHGRCNLYVRASAETVPAFAFRSANAGDVWFISKRVSLCFKWMFHCEYLCEAITPIELGMILRKFGENHIFWSIVKKFLSPILDLDCYDLTRLLCICERFV
jgi:hypothetical protein